MRYSRSLGRGLVLAAVLGAAGAAASAQAQESVESFYSGRTIDFIIGFPPGGGYDQYSRLVARFLPRHIPGNPSIVVRNMPGGGSRTAVNHLYHVAPQDGSVLGTADHSLPMEQAMGDPTLNLDMAQFNYIGNPTVANNVLVTWHTWGIETIEDARQTAVPIGSSGSATTYQYPMVMNTLLGTQFEIIAGYQGGNDMNVAMENGELAGRGSNSWASYKAFQPHWIEEGLIDVIVQIGLEKEPDLPDVPLLLDLAENEEDREMLTLLSAPVMLGRPVFTTPNVPEERVAALREAFDAMVEDPDFLAAAEAEGLEITPVSGARLQEIVDEIIATPPEVGRRLAEVGGTVR